MLESKVEGALVDKIEALGGECWKFVSPGRRGVPDRLVLLPGGRAIFVELKAPGKEARAQQRKRHKELRALGFEVEVLDTIQKVNDYVERLKEVVR